MTALQISDKLARKIYPTADAELKDLLEENFGKPFFSQKIADKVKTFEDACEVLGIDADVIYSDNDEQDEVAYRQLKIIVKALNEGWEPNYNNSNERKWYPWFYMDQPGFRLNAVGYGNASSSVGSRLVFKTEELARYAANQFLSLYKDYLA